MDNPCSAHGLCALSDSQKTAFSGSRQHCLVLDGVYRRGSDGEPLFVEASTPTDEALQAVLHKIITRMMKLLTRRGVLIEEQGQTYLADNDADSDEARVLRPLQAAAWPCRPRRGQWRTNSPLDCLCPGSAYRIAFGPRAGRKVLTVQGAMPREADFKQNLCADIDGFSLHAAVRCGADDRQALEQLCRYITRPALANERVQTNAAGQVAGARGQVLPFASRRSNHAAHVPPQGDCMRGQGSRGQGSGLAFCLKAQ